MNDDYLWDKSGKPDPNIKQLEEILGTLRYQPRKLEIPPHIQTGRKNLFSRGLAIAAAVALVVLGLGVWMGLHRQQTTQLTATKSAEVDNSNGAPASPVDVKKLSNLQAAAPATNRNPEKVATSSPRRRLALAGNTNQMRNLETRRPKLSEGELAEAKVAKDQLMLALRVASSKLNLAQKKTQGINSENPIQNQHKAG